MITGGTGSFGNAVLNRFLKTDIGEIRIFSRDEKKQDAMRTSKYVQSDVSDVYDTIKKDAHEGRFILFSGPPCQCAAVRKLFGDSIPDNLYIMELLCHSVLSQKVFDEYLDDIRKNIPNKQYVPSTCGTSALESKR